MKLTLMIEGSAATIAAVLASLPQDAEAITLPDTFMQMTGRGEHPKAPTQTQPEIAPTTSMPASGTGSPVMPSAPIQPVSDDDDGDAGTPSDAATDSTGLPWDERIHASTKTQTVKGTWTKRKRVDEATVAAVEAELRAGIRVPEHDMTGVAPNMPGAAPAMPVPIPMMPVQTPPTPQPMPMAMPTTTAEPEPEPVAMPAAAPAQTGPSFPEFMQKISSLMAGDKPKLTTDNLVWLSGQLGVAAITDLGVQPEKIGQAVDLLRQYEMWDA